MTDPTDPAPDEPTQEVPVPELPAPPAPGPEAATSPPPAPQRPRGPSLGHIVLGAVLVLIGVGWLLEALEVTDVPWRFLLPSVLVLVGLALTLGARTGRHGGLLAVGIVLTALVLLAGAIEVVADVPLAGGLGDKNHHPTAAVQSEYRWGVGKMTLDLSEAQDLAGREIAASVVLGELVVIVPDGVDLVITARAGLGDVNVLGRTADGVDPSLRCVGSNDDIDCSEGAARGERPLRLDLEVAVGKVAVQSEEVQG